MAAFRLLTKLGIPLITSLVRIKGTEMAPCIRTAAVLRPLIKLEISLISSLVHIKADEMALRIRTAA